MISAIVILAVLIAFVAIVVVVIQENKKGPGLMSIIKLIYLLTMVAFLIMFVAFGISAFYPAPENPRPAEFSPRLVKITPPEQGTPEYDEWQAEQDAALEVQQIIGEENMKQRVEYQQQMKDYRRNIFLIAFPFGLLYVLLGLTLKPRLEIIKPALLLGGMGTVIYALTQADLSSQVRFAGIAVGLPVLLYAGYKTLLEKKPVSEN